MNRDSTLRDGLRTLAGQAPRAAVPDDFYARAHARARQRRAVRAIAAVVTLLVLAVGLGLRPATTAVPGSPAPAATPGIPQRLRIPPWYTATAEQSRPGRVAVIFGGTATHGDWNEGRFGMVAADADRYRVINVFTYPLPGVFGLLSPDGTWIASERAVFSPVTGERVPLPGAVHAFSPDSTLVVLDTAEGTRYDEANQPHTDGRLIVYDLVRRVEVAAADSPDFALTEGWGAAVSPDNTRLAVQSGDEIRVLRIQDGRLRQATTLRLDGEMLAGPGAWQPGGQTFVTARYTGPESWTLVPRSADTGQPSTAAALPTVTDAHFVRVVGWRDDGTAVLVAGVPNPGTEPPPFRPGEGFGSARAYNVKAARLVALSPDATRPEVLLETPNGIQDIDVAADLAVAGALRPAADPDYGPWSNITLTIGALCVLFGLAPVALLIWRRLRRRRAVSGGH